MQYFSLQNGWRGFIQFGEVSNDAINYKPIGDEHFVYSVDQHNENGFSAECIDQKRFFKYFRMSESQTQLLSDVDRQFLSVVYF